MDEEELKELTEIADNMFSNGVWSNSKEQMKYMSKRESSSHMFRLGFFMHHQYSKWQMKNLAEELKGMSKEDVEKMINEFKKDKQDKNE